MSEHYEPLLADPTSYVSPNGDVLPIADTEVPRVHDDQDDIDASVIDAMEAVEAAEAKQHAKKLFWPVAEIPTADIQMKNGENYLKAKATIEEGIADSIARNLPQYMVKIWVKETQLHQAKRQEVPLSIFFASNAGGVSSDEYRVLYAEFGPANEAYNEAHKDEIAQLEKARDDSLEQKIGGAVTKAVLPASAYEIVRGALQFRDIASLVAHDPFVDGK